VPPFFVSSRLRPSAEKVDLCSGSPEAFRTPKGSLQTRHPLTKAALCELAEIWPLSVKMPDLLQRTRARLGPLGLEESSAGQDGSSLCQFLLQAYAADMVEFHLYQPAMCARPGDRPLASALARWEAMAGEEEVTTLRHTRVQLDQIGRHLLTLLDGTRDQAALLAEVEAFVASKSLPEVDRNALPAHLEVNLLKLARLGLLVS
jgi:hypothetical protein